MAGPGSQGGRREILSNVRVGCLYGTGAFWSLRGPNGIGFLRYVVLVRVMGFPLYGWHGRELVGVGFNKDE